MKYQFPATGREQLELESAVYPEILTTVVMVVGLHMPVFLIPKVIVRFLISEMFACSRFFSEN